jgi:ribonucleotide reductase beta subunit family protein with ferritin-like domain
LAERLYWNMRRLDPDTTAPDWAGLSDRERRYYRLLVADLIEFEELIRLARRA